MNICNSERTLLSHLMLVAVLMEYMSANEHKKIDIWPELFQVAWGQLREASKEQLEMFEANKGWKQYL